MIERGVVPEGTALTDINPLPGDARAADGPGQALEETGQLDNTIVIYCADNGASGEGSPIGSVNENKFFNAYPDDLADNLSHLDDLGSPNTYNHYPTGWATAFSAPFKMFKRYTYQGGVADPLVICWPNGIQAGERCATSTTTR